MLQETVVSDFDGVWTDPTKEAEKYTVAFSEKLSQRIHIGLVELNGLMQAAGETIKQSPGIFGWEYKGRIIAPATADPYIFNQVAARLTLDNLRAEKNTSMLNRQGHIDKVLGDIFVSLAGYSALGSQPLSFIGVTTMLAGRVLSVKSLQGNNGSMQCARINL